MGGRVSYVITTTRTDRNGRYRVVVKPDRLGLLTRIVPLDRQPIIYLLRII